MVSSTLGMKIKVGKVKDRFQNIIKIIFDFWVSACQVPVLSLGLSNIAHTVSPMKNSLFKSLKELKKSSFN